METSQSHDVEQEVQRRMEAIGARFRDRFSDEQLEQIRARVLRSVEFGATLRAFDVPNQVGPDFDPRAMTRE